MASATFCLDHARVLQLLEARIDTLSHKSCYYKKLNVAEQSTISFESVQRPSLFPLQETDGHWVALLEHESNTPSTLELS